MKNYYLKNGEKVTGPFVLDDLKYQRITSNTLVSIDQGPWQEITTLNDLKPIVARIFSGAAMIKGSANTVQKSTAVNQVQNSSSKKYIVLAVAIAVFMMGLGMAVLLFAELK